MEIGFYHPSRGYWQTTNAPSADILASYPDGTIEVPLRPSPYAEWVKGAWVDRPPPAPSADDVRAECARRMSALVAGYTPEERETWPVQIAEARAVIDGATSAPMLSVLAEARGLSLEAFAASVLRVAEATTAATAALLAAQARLLSMPTIPTDFADSKWWA